MTHVKFNGRPVARHYDDFLGDFFNFPVSAGRDFSSAPSANVSETQQAYYLELNAPGRNKGDFKINIDKDLLTVSYEKKEETVAEGTKSVRREFSFNSFKRSFTLDEKVNVSNIEAKYENGILKIELPKKEQFKEEPKEISIR